MVPQVEFDQTCYCDKYHERFRRRLISTLEEKKKVVEIITTHYPTEHSSSTLNPQWKWKCKEVFKDGWNEAKRKTNLCSCNSYSCCLRSILSFTSPSKSFSTSLSSCNTKIQIYMSCRWLMRVANTTQYNSRHRGFLEPYRMLQNCPLLSFVTQVAIIYAKFLEENLYIRKRFNPHRIGLVHQHGCHFIEKTDFTGVTQLLVNL